MVPHPFRVLPVSWHFSCSFIYLFCWCKIAHSCPTLCNPMDCSPPGSSVQGILQARILNWVAISFSRGSSRPRDQTWVSRIAGRRFNLWATREALIYFRRSNYFFKYLFIYLSVPALSCSTQGLPYLLWHVVSLVVAHELLVAACGI